MGEWICFITFQLFISEGYIDLCSNIFQFYYSVSKILKQYILIINMDFEEVKSNKVA